MGILYHYVNHDKREYVVLHELNVGGGDKEGAAVRVGGALVWLLLGDGLNDTLHVCSYRGRWAGDRIDVLNSDQHLCDSRPHGRGEGYGIFYDALLKVDSNTGAPYQNISAPLREELAREEPFLLRLWTYYNCA
jgi:hypothetical protein